MIATVVVCGLMSVLGIAILIRICCLTAALPAGICIVPVENPVLGRTAIASKTFIMTKSNNTANVCTTALDCQYLLVSDSGGSRLDVRGRAAGKHHVASTKLVRKFSARVHDALLGSEHYDDSAYASRAEEVGGVWMLLGIVR
jgi:hypothetical protein